MTDWNVPIDNTHKISATIMAHVRGALLAVRQPDWEPSPMPEEYLPAADEVLHPAPYDTPFLTILADRMMAPNHHGDEVFFYDYSLRVGGPPLSGLYP